VLLIRCTVIKELQKYGINEIAGRALHEVPLDELLDHLHRVEMEHRRKGA
jgi:hypothetical protein